MLIVAHVWKKYKQHWTIHLKCENCIACERHCQRVVTEINPNSPLREPIAKRRAGSCSQCLVTRCFLEALCGLVFTYLAIPRQTDGIHMVPECTMTKTGKSKSLSLCFLERVDFPIMLTCFCILRIYVWREFIHHLPTTICYHAF